MFAVAIAGRFGWWPEGDDAIMALRTRAVFSTDPPLMGMRTTTGLHDSTLSSHHPGPLLFYLMAPAAAIAGFGGLGMAIGAGALAGSSAVASVMVARRSGGATAAWLTGIAALLVQGLIGVEGLFRPFNPYAGVLPALLMLVCAWALVNNDLACTWLFLLSASVVAQANLAFAPLVAVVASALGVLGLWRWRQRHRTWRPLRRSHSRTLTQGHKRRLRERTGWIGAGVLLACWVPSFVELVRFSPNNVHQLFKFITSDSSEHSAGEAATSSIIVLAARLNPFGMRTYGPDLLLDTSALAVTGGVLLLVLLVVAALPLPLHRSLQKYASSAANRLRPSLDKVRHLIVAKDQARLGGSALPPGRQQRRAVSACRIALLALTGQVLVLQLQPRGLPALYWVVTIYPVVAFAWMALTLRVLDFGRRHLRIKQRRLPWWIPVSSTALAAFLVMTLWQPLRIEASSQANRVGTATESYLRSAADPFAPIVITPHGGTSWLTWSCAVAYRLESAGSRTYCMSSWPYEEDTTPIHIDKAPADAVRVDIYDEDSPELAAAEKSKGSARIIRVHPWFGQPGAAVIVHVPDRWIRR